MVDRGRDGSGQGFGRTLVPGQGFGASAPSGAATSLIELDQRSREIFRRIVDAYLETGEPMGSRNVSKLLQVALSPASVRNVMADLEALGLIYSPHTSAGRLPTDRGLRLFVDAMLEVGELGRPDRERIEAQVASAGDGRTFDGVLSEASQLLSGVSRGAGVVLTHKADLRLKHIEFVRLEPTRGLVVLVGADGSVENRIVTLPAGLPSSALTEATNYLNAHIRDRTLSESKTALERLSVAEQAELDELTRRLVDQGIAVWSEASEDGPGTLIIRGRANLLEDLKAAEDLERIRLLFEDLEQKRDLVQLLGLAEAGDGVRIFIGSENKLFSLSGSSLVVAPYRDKESRIVGVLGVIGPTRLNYARIVPVVDYTAKVVGRLIG